MKVQIKNDTIYCTDYRKCCLCLTISTVSEGRCDYCGKEVPEDSTVTLEELLQDMRAAQFADFADKIRKSERKMSFLLD